MLRRFQDWLALTATERRVLLFLTGAFAVGLGIRLYQETFPSSRRFEYSGLDSAYAALSAAALSEAADNAGNVSQGRLNINTATKQQLEELPGVGGVTAERIILYRKSRGPFRTVEELRSIKGISKRKLDKIKPLISVN